MAIWDKVLGAVTGPVATYFTRRAELKQARFEAELKFEQASGDRRAKLISEGLAADANWEMEFARQAANSWKDEYTLIVVSIPMLMAFVPSLAVFVEQGFAALGKTPVWYQTVLVSLFMATVGIRWWRRNQSDT